MLSYDSQDCFLASPCFPPPSGKIKMTTDDGDNRNMFELLLCEEAGWAETLGVRTGRHWGGLAKAFPRTTVEGHSGEALGSGHHESNEQNETAKGRNGEKAGRVNRLQACASPLSARGIM